MLFKILFFLLKPFGFDPTAPQDLNELCCQCEAAERTFKEFEEVVPANAVGETYAQGYSELLRETRELSSHGASLSARAAKRARTPSDRETAAELLTATERVRELSKRIEQRRDSFRKP